MAFNATRFLVGHAGPKLISTSLRNIQGRFMSTASYEMIKIGKKGVKQNVAVVTLNRPKALNAMCKQLAGELSQAVENFDKDPSVGAIIITGSETLFAAGADIKEMLVKTYCSNFYEGTLSEFEKIKKCKKPVVAAVNGYVLGGGCELVMLCDIIYAGEEAIFGQPEVLIGTIPGAGGTQRIARSCGKSKGMEICLSGNRFTAQEAEKMGLVSKVVPSNQLLDETVKLCEKIASHSPIIVSMCKEAVNVAFESTLEEGLRFEQRAFYATFTTEDRKEGMSAFVEKRSPNFKNN